MRESFPDHVADAWIGHDKRVAKQNYLQIKNDHFQRAIEGTPKSGAQSGAVCCGRTSQAGARKKGGSQKPRDLQRIAATCDSVQEPQVGVTGIEQVSHSSDEKPFLDPSDAQSDALETLVRTWPQVPASVRNAIAQLIEPYIGRVRKPK